MQDNEREWLFLAGIITDPTLYVVGSSIVEPEALSNTGSVIYDAIKQLHNSDSSVTTESIAYYLSQNGKLHMIGGMTILDTLKHIDFRLDTDGFKRLSEDIAKLGQKKVVKTILRSLSDIDDEPEVIINEAIQSLYNLSFDNNTDKFIPIEESLKIVQTRHPLSSTTLPKLDKIISGLVKSEYIIVAARPSIGKTALGLQLGTYTALQNIPTAIYSLEQGRDAVTNRIKRIVGGDVSQLVGAPLYLRCDPSLTVSQIVADTTLAVMMYGVQVIVVDYIGLVNGQKDNQTRNNFLEYVSRSLQNLSRKLGIVVIALAQLNRNSEREDREPGLYDLRDCGGLEQDPDIVILLHKRRREDDNATIIVAKQREGEIGKIQVRFDRECVMFVED